MAEIQLSYPIKVSNLEDLGTAIDHLKARAEIVLEELERENEDLENEIEELECEVEDLENEIEELKDELDAFR